MVVIRSALENGKQQTNPRINPNYFNGAIHENVPKLRNSNKKITKLDMSEVEDMFSEIKKT